MLHRFALRLIAFLSAGLLICWRATLTIRIEGDPRPGLRASGRRYIYAILHAQQLAFILLSDDIPIQAMVSASSDGDWLVPLCHVRGIIPVRGSTRKNGLDKGGRTALAAMAEGVRNGVPALLAVDGPRGPRGHVHRGVVDLARETGACIVVAGVFLSPQRYVLHKSWDRTQIPRPFSRLTGRFRPPIDPRDFAEVGDLRAHVAAELLALERAHDPAEAVHMGRERRIASEPPTAGAAPRSA